MLEEEDTGPPPASPDKEIANKEVDQYLKRIISKTTKEESFENPLIFWLKNESLFPHLSQVALQILTIPSASADVERLFSLAGNMLGLKRLSMTTKNVGMMCKLNRRKDEPNAM